VPPSMFIVMFYYRISGAGNVVLILYLHFRLSVQFLSFFAMYVDHMEFPRLCGCLSR
jgi:hypothetical protein